MPYYEYRCPDCREETTVQYVSHKDVLPTIECPWCGGTMQKRISAPAFNVKGFNAKNGYSQK
jgi:putative FmdB family regulatory protein